MPLFELIPFNASEPAITVTGRLDVSGPMIEINYQLTGELQDLQWAETIEPAERRMNLWEHTCFEFFIGHKNSTAYQEFNLSPGGHWNCFSFTDVREGMTLSDSLILLNHNNGKTEHSAFVEARIQSTLTGREDLVIGISAVLEQQKKLHYYALVHGKQPDFHSRENHIL